MYKMIVSEFDNVLIDQEEAISTEAILEISRIRKAGILFCIMTSKSLSEILEYNRDFPFIDYIICFNGACIYDVHNKKCIYQKKILFSIIKPIMKLLSNYEVRCFTANEVVSNPLEKKEDIYKMSVKTHDEKDLKFLKEKLLDFDINIRESFVDSEIYVEIIMGNVSKLDALLKLCNKKKIDLNHVCTIGGEKEIMGTCGFSVSVNNSPATIKENAAFVTQDNYSYGVAEFLKTL